MASKDKKAAGTNLRGKFATTQQTEAYRQLVKMEERVLGPRNKKDIEKHKDKFDANLNYFTMYNKDGTMTSSIIKPKDTKNSVENFYKSLPFYSESVNTFDPKVKKDRTYSLQKMKEGPLSKDVLEMPNTTSQEIGWRKPIDTMNLGFGLKNYFPESLMGASIRDSPKKRDK